MPPRWMKEREMRLVTFSRAVPLMSLEGIYESDHEELGCALERGSGFWIALSQPLWKARR